jgi:hypothetical protein
MQYKIIKLFEKCLYKFYETLNNEIYNDFKRKICKQINYLFYTLYMVFG